MVLAVKPLGSTRLTNNNFAEPCPVTVAAPSINLFPGNSGEIPIGSDHL